MSATRSSPVFEPKEYCDIFTSDAFSNRCIGIVYFLGCVRLWAVLDHWSILHCMLVSISCAFAEYLRINASEKYYRHRNTIAVFLSFFSQAGPGGWGIYYGLMSKAPSTYTFAAVAAAAVYILGSFFFFNRPWLLSLLPHIISSVLVLPFALYNNPRVCDTAVMRTKAAESVIKQVFIKLGAAQHSLAPASASSPPPPSSSSGSNGAFQHQQLSPRGMCAVTSNTLMIAMGFLLPTLILATREAAEFRSFRLKNNRRAHAPWMQRQLYRTLGSKDSIDRIRVYLIMALVVHITWTCHLKVFSA